MSHSKKLITRLLLVGGALLAGACSDSESAEGRPNIILIVVDTLRADAVIDPAGLFETPHLDQLAADSVVFPSAFSHAPLTLPSHTSLFSSRPPFETGVLNNGQTVPEKLPMLAEWLSEYGYATRAVISLGTLNLGTQAGVKRGFDVYDVDFWRMAKAPEVAERVTQQVASLSAEKPTFFFAHYCDPHAPYSAHDTVDRRVQIKLGDRLIDEVPVTEGPKWRMTTEAAGGKELMEVTSDSRFRIRHVGVSQGGKPLPTEWLESKRLVGTKRAVIEFEAEAGEVELSMWMNDDLNRTESRERYGLEVTFVDEYVGRLLDELRDKGLYDNSIILFVSDHGESLGEHGHVGHAQSLTDVQLRVPLLIKLPKGHPMQGALAARSDDLVPMLNLTPTILELVGLPPLPGQRGKSIMDGSATLHVAQTHKPEAKRDQVCFRDDEFKMVFFPEEDRFEMYEYASDPGELADVFETRKSEREPWMEQLRTIAQLASERTLREGDLSEALELDLEALGYGGSEE